MIADGDGHFVEAAVVGGREQRSRPGPQPDCGYARRAGQDDQDPADGRPVYDFEWVDADRLLHRSDADVTVRADEDRVDLDSRRPSRGHRSTDHTSLVDSVEGLT